MKQILVTGATGNIGLEVVHYLNALNSDCEIIAAVRHVADAKQIFTDTVNLQFRQFDFENPETLSAAFHLVDVLFLLRPPQISEVDKFFRPLLVAAKANCIRNVVFLSVQGAEKSKVIPHNKIENLIQELEFNYIFVRSSYFMQNLTTTLLPEIVKDKRITLPSGKAKFNWIDVKNIGEATAYLIFNFAKYQNRSFEITGTENKNFAEVVKLMSEITGETISFQSINPISFYFKKRKEGMASGFAVVMTTLHFLPRFQKEPDISDHYQKLTGKKPTSIREFIAREKEKITASQQ
ncbi:NmrA family NAD(P)-binding protein [Aquiflexum lacus]|uniref:NmrA family NAD(P)-binding protein n=1 Tax=Aquiflexum lacus TaxID=2483805 RepID=UPI001894E512|nr:NmrA family NAD(P)-binding protein [Aquiflexum lacus]